MNISIREVEDPKANQGYAFLIESERFDGSWSFPCSRELLSEVVSKMIEETFTPCT